MATKSTRNISTKKKAATKKVAARTVVQGSGLPTPEFTADLAKVFKKHGLPGLPQHLSFASVEQCDRICPNGEKAVPTWINCPGGVTKMVCACPGEDPSCD
jgi:hypothetical protein